MNLSGELRYYLSHLNDQVKGAQMRKYKQLTKRLVQKAMDAKLTHHLGYDKSSPTGNNTGNSRNGKSSKTIKGDFGEQANF